MRTSSAARRGGPTRRRPRNWSKEKLARAPARLRAAIIALLKLHALIFHARYTDLLHGLSSSSLGAAFAPLFFYSSSSSSCVACSAADLRFDCLITLYAVFNSRSLSLVLLRNTARVRLWADRRETETVLWREACVLKRIDPCSTNLTLVHEAS